MLATYRNQLREYRALQEELTPWTQAFQQRHGRKPRLADVEHTGTSPVLWLVLCSLHSASPTSSTLVRPLWLVLYPLHTGHCAMDSLAESPGHLAGRSWGKHSSPFDQMHVCTGVEWLIAKYKCYLMMRERVVMDTPQLRSKLTSAKPGAGTIAVCVPWLCSWQMIWFCDYMGEQSDRIRNRVSAKLCSARCCS